MIIVAAAFLVIWQINVHQPGSSVQPTTSTSAPTKSRDNGVSGLPGATDHQLYWDAINQHTAQGLHLSVAQVQTKLQQLMNSSAPGPKGGNGDPAAAMLQLAIQQGLSGSQLQALEIAAVQHGCNALVRAGSMTHDQANQRMQNIRGWDANELNGYQAYGFLQRANG